MWDPVERKPIIVLSLKKEIVYIFKKKKKVELTANAVDIRSINLDEDLRVLVLNDLSLSYIIVLELITIDDEFVG